MKMMLIPLLVFVNLWGSRAEEGWQELGQATEAHSIAQSRTPNLAVGEPSNSRLTDCATASTPITDLEKKLFVFPTASRTAHVVLNAKPQHPLKAFTVCLRLYTDLTRSQTIFSYASKRQANEIVVDRTSPNEYRLYVGNEYVSFKAQGRETYRPAWEHICMSWGTGTGLAVFSLNGQPTLLKGLKKGYTISPKASILLGQDQDYFGGGFDANQCFVGEVMDVYMFDRLLYSEEVNLLMIGSALPQSDALIGWTSLSYNVKGYVVVWPSTFWTSRVRGNLLKMPPSDTYSQSSLYANLPSATRLICKGQNCCFPRYPRLCSRYPRLCSRYPSKACRDLQNNTFRTTPETSIDVFKLASRSILKGSTLVVGAVWKRPASSGRTLKHSEIFGLFLMAS